MACAEALILHGGKIYGADDGESLVLKDGRIAALGRWEDLCAQHETARAVDLRGRCVLPGFIDAHVHLLQTGLTEIGWRIDLSGLPRDESLARLAAAVQKGGHGEWVVGSGWDESRWEVPSYLDRRELDRISLRTPLVAVRLDGHLLVANSVAMREIELSGGADVSSLVDGKTGQVREAAAWRTLERVRPDETVLSDALAAATRLCHSVGVTSVHTMARPQELHAIVAGRGRDGLRVLVCPSVSCLDALEAVGMTSGFGDEWVRYGGVKIFADGSIGARNAAVGRPYDDGGRGELNHSDADLEAMIRRADSAGWQTVIHAIGDRAIDQVLRLHALIGTDPELRHRIEHFELATERQIGLARDLGLAVCMQPNFIANWSGPGSMYESRLGAERDAASNPLRRMVDGGLDLAFGSDGMPISPLGGIHATVNAPFAEQRVTVDEAIEAYTRGGARLSFEEGVRGDVAVGAHADLVVLDEDPRVSPGFVRERSVEMTIVGGRCVYTKGVEET